MATKTGVTAKLKVLYEVFDDDAIGAGVNMSLGTAAHLFEHMYNLSCGTSDGQINLVYGKKGLTIAASATTTFDLAGSLVDDFGHTLTFTVVKQILVRNRNTASVDILHMGPGTSNGFTGFTSGTSPLIVVPPGIAGQAGWAATAYDPVGRTVTAGTGDIWRVVEVGATNTVTYDILIIGEGTYA